MHFESGNYFELFIFDEEIELLIWFEFRVMYYCPFIYVFPSVDGNIQWKMEEVTSFVITSIHLYSFTREYFQIVFWVTFLPPPSVRLYRSIAHLALFHMRAMIVFAGVVLVLLFMNR